MEMADLERIRELIARHTEHAPGPFMNDENGDFFERLVGAEVFEDKHFNDFPELRVAFESQDVAQYLAVLTPVYPYRVREVMMLAMDGIVAEVERELRDLEEDTSGDEPSAGSVLLEHGFLPVGVTRFNHFICFDFRALPGESQVVYLDRDFMLSKESPDAWSRFELRSAATKISPGIETFLKLLLDEATHATGEGADLMKLLDGLM